MDMGKSAKKTLNTLWFKEISLRPTLHYVHQEEVDDYNSKNNTDDNIVFS
jgi:hypothetical protein